MLCFQLYCCNLDHGQRFSKLPAIFSQWQECWVTVPHCALDISATPGIGYLAVTEIKGGQDRKSCSWEGIQAYWCSNDLWWVVPTDTFSNIRPAPPPCCLTKHPRQRKGSGRRSSPGRNPAFFYLGHKQALEHRSPTIIRSPCFGKDTTRSWTRIPWPIFDALARCFSAGEGPWDWTWKSRYSRNMVDHGRACSRGTCSTDWDIEFQPTSSGKAAEICSYPAQRARVWKPPISLTIWIREMELATWATSHCFFTAWKHEPDLQVIKATSVGGRISVIHHAQKGYHSGTACIGLVHASRGDCDSEKWTRRESGRELGSTESCLDWRRSCIYYYIWQANTIQQPQHWMGNRVVHGLGWYMNLELKRPWSFLQTTFKMNHISFVWLEIF